MISQSQPRALSAFSRPPTHPPTHPPTYLTGSDLAELTEFQRVTSIATLRGAPVVLVNPALSAFSHLPASLMDPQHVQPMILSDFQPCYQVGPPTRHLLIFFGPLCFPRLPPPPTHPPTHPLPQASAHTYKYNPFLSYSIVRRGDKGGRGEEEEEEGPWEVFAHDRRLPDSSWAYLESRREEPFRLEVVRPSSLLPPTHLPTF